MTVEQLREKGWIIFEAISGSRAYGTELPTSDTDIRGVFVQPTDQILRGDWIPQISDKTNDVTFYEIGKFIELLQKGNPNILELLNVTEDCVVYQHADFIKWFWMDKNKYLTQKLRHTFSGYGYAQIKKAKGLNKKIHNPQPKERKTPADFCYIIEGAKSKPLLKEFSLNSLKNAGVVSNQNGKGLYFLYPNIPSNKEGQDYYFQFKGLINEDETSNGLRLSHIPMAYLDHRKALLIEGYNHFQGVTIWYDEDAYKMHCRQWKEYWEWVEARNDDRYKDNMKGEVGYDHKNMMHCVRLVEMAEDIVTKKAVVVRRPNRDYLLSIRNGEHKYEELLEMVEKKVEGLEDLFKNSDLPHKVSLNYCKDLLLTIRTESYERIIKSNTESGK